MDLDDIPMETLEEDREVEVELRFGRKARLTFPTGEVQAELYKNADLTPPEMVSILLSHCVLGSREGRLVSSEHGNG